MSSDDKRDKYEPVGEFVRIFCRGKTWWVNYQHDGKQIRRTLKTRSKKQAKLEALKIEGKLQKGESVRAKRTATIDEILDAYDAYLIGEGRAKKTLSKYRAVMTHMKTLAGKRHTTHGDGIDLAFVDAYRSQRRRDKAGAKTIHVETVVIKQIVKFAVGRELLSDDKLKGLKLTRPRPTPQPCWSVAQRGRILEAARATPYYELFCLLAETGMRISEAKYLTWDDVDLENGFLYIRPKQIGPDKADMWTPKTGDQRVVPLAQVAVDRLQKMRRSCRWVFTAKPTRSHPRRDRPIDERRVLYHLKKVLKHLDLPGHLHTFRHTLISQALVNGTPESVVRQWVGHVDAEILKHYTHIANTDSKAYMQRLHADRDGEGAGEQD